VVRREEEGVWAQLWFRFGHNCFAALTIWFLLLVLIVIVMLLSFGQCVIDTIRGNVASMLPCILNAFCIILKQPSSQQPNSKMQLFLYKLQLILRICSVQIKFPLLSRMG